MKGLLLLEYLEIKKKWYIFALALILLCFGAYFETLFTFVFIFSVFGSRDVGNNFERNKKINKYILTTKFSRKDLIISKLLVSTLKILLYFIILRSFSFLISRTWAWVKERKPVNTIVKSSPHGRGSRSRSSSVMVQT